MSADDQPSPIQEERIAAGALGRKTGEGFHRYEDGRRVGISQRFARPSTGLEGAAIRGRIEAAIAAEAHRVVDEGIASPADVDLALRLGAGHPRGPFGTGAATD